MKAEWRIKLPATIRCGLAAVAFATSVSTAASGCDLALVLAVDVSLSVDMSEFSLQTRGTADALLDERVKAALLSSGTGVSIAFVQWSGRHDQVASTSWTHVTTASELEQLSATIRGTARQFQSRTAPGSAIEFASVLHQSNPLTCDRKVIDVSGDGVENTGLRTRDARVQAVARDITINGLVVSGADDDVEGFYRHNVIGGPGAFLETANGYEDYPRAIRDKLLKELPQMMAMELSQ